jgi:hypothetical protein
MLKDKRLITVAALLALAVGLQACAPNPKAEEDCGFVQNVYGERISWNGQPVTMYPHSSVPTQYYPALKAAAETWNRAAGKTIIIVSDQSYNGEAAARDRTNVISFSPTWDQKNLAEQAKTSVNWVGDQIQEADIKINAAKIAGTSVFTFYWQGTVSGGINIEALVLHEMGHVLGLKHNDGQTSVMATYLANNNDRTTLSDSDRASVQCEYK